MTKLDRRPFVLIVRDGWGANPDPAWNKANAVHLGSTPADDRLMAQYPHVQITTCGEDVGLPAGVMGNSEVGHQNIGAGRIVDQEVMRITGRIRDASFFSNEALCGALACAEKSGGAVHVMGLCSDGRVHSDLDHLYALLELARRRGFPGDRVFVHFFGDGRDTQPESGVDFVRQIESRMNQIGVGRIASVIGRYYAMDRDNRWDRVERAYRLLTEGKGRSAGSAADALRWYYANPSEPSRKGDEFVEPTVITGDGGEPPATIRDGDGVIFYNYRGDRPRELTRAFVLETFPYADGEGREQGFARGKKPDVYFATMTAYERGLPTKVAFEKPEGMESIFGAYVSDLGLRQFRCAETEKYPHVTYFFNDYREEPLAGEDRALIPSPQEVSTYDQKPEMSALEVTAETVRRIESGTYDVVVMNYANGDMVGHTGSLEAAIRAVEAVDRCVGQVVEATQKMGGMLIVTADHGNCEQMIEPSTGGPHTAHTTFPVELIVVDDRFKGARLRAGGRLADIIPTALTMMGLAKPAAMTGESLLEA